MKACGRERNNVKGELALFTAVIAPVQSAALGVGVNDEDLKTGFGESPGEVNAGGRLACPALLIGNGDCDGHVVYIRA